MRGLPGDPVPCVRRWRLDRCLYQCNSPPARAIDGTAQGSHRTVGAWLSAFEEDDPLSAVADLRSKWTMSRKTWQIRIETQMRLSCTPEVFLLQASLCAWECADEVCRREWDRSIPRDLL